MVDVQRKNTHQSTGNTQMPIESSKEYQLILAYTQKRVASYSHHPQSNGVGEKKFASPVSPVDCCKREIKKKRKNQKLLKLLGCIRPVKEDDSSMTENHRPLQASDSCTDQEELEDLVNKLTTISSSVHFSDEGLETDSDDVVDKIVEILREQGDKLNEEIIKNHILMQQLHAVLSYSFFKKVTETFMMRLYPGDIPPTQNKEQATVALTCEITTRLNVMDCHPMNRVLGFGARYLQENFTLWDSKQEVCGEELRTNNDADDEVH